jgi:hypothetical protein
MASQLNLNANLWVESMKYSHQVLVLGIALIMIGLVLGFNHMLGFVEMGLFGLGLGIKVARALRHGFQELLI